jgi:F-box protein 9
MDRETKLSAISETAPTVPAQSADNEADEDVGNSPLWMREEEGWELTWPIWHMLPRHERREIAQRNGYKTIGEFEEFMSLEQAFDDSQVKGSKLVYPEETPKSERESFAKKQAKKDEDEEYDSEDDDRPEYHKMASSGGEDLSIEELMLVGGKILMLHDEILHQVFSFLPVDTYGTLAVVSPHWKHLTRTESVYKRLCERLYLNQSKRRQLHVSRFGGSYRNMLEQRPRVRAAGGCYILKYSHIKKIQRDMWTEVPVGAILETVYYRYLYFQEDGRVLYALSSAPPHLMFKRLLKVCLNRVDDPAAVWGTFQVQKDALSITARQEWHTVKFDLTIDTNSIHGRFGSLRLDRHLSSPSGSFEDWSGDRVEYDVPEQTFGFIRDPRL